MLMLFVIFLLCFTFCIYKKIGFNLFINDIFWLFIWWGLIIGVYLFSGIKYGNYGFSSQLLLFLFSCICLYLLGRWIGKHSKFITLRINQLTFKKLLFFKVLAWVGTIIFVIDYIRLNGILLSAKSSYNLSLLGTVGNLFIPLLLILGVYEFIECLQNKRRISLSAISMLIGYSLPCILNSGRESIIYIGITLLAAFSYAKMNVNYINGKVFKNRGTKYVIIGILLLGVLVLYKITEKRFGDNEISTFLYYHNLPIERISFIESFGKFKFIYYNVISYFSHQIPYLDFTLRTYFGPYLGGLFEFNIISRRLPSFLGLDYMLVYEQMSNLFIIHGVQRYFSGGWNTVLGSLICDFSAWGVPIVCLIIGYVIGNIRKKMLKTQNITYGVIMSIVCGTMFSSIQLGPFYSFSICGSFVWWFLVFGKKKQQDYCYNLTNDFI